jgi:hypothetical protein
MTLCGADPIIVCKMPTEDLVIEGEVMKNQESVKADLKDDIPAYDKKMLENFHAFFKEKVEDKSTIMLTVKPAEEAGCAPPRSSSRAEPCAQSTEALSRRPSPLGRRGSEQSRETRHRRHVRAPTTNAAAVPAQD